LRNGQVQFLHGGNGIGGCCLDVVGTGGAHIRMTEDHLNGLLRDSQRIQVAPQSAPRCVPPVPERFQSGFFRAGRITRPWTLLRLSGFPFLARKIGPDSGFPQRIR